MPMTSHQIEWTHEFCDILRFAYMVCETRLSLAYNREWDEYQFERIEVEATNGKRREWIEAPMWLDRQLRYEIDTYHREEITRKCREDYESSRLDSYRDWKRENA